MSSELTAQDSTRSVADTHQHRFLRCQSIPLPSRALLRRLTSEPYQMVSLESVRRIERLRIEAAKLPHNSAAIAVLWFLTMADQT